MDGELLGRLIQIAKDRYDGHLTIMRFTTNWRVGFTTLDERAYVNYGSAVGKTFEEAAVAA
ncbi:MAG: hypothetical protein EBX70_12340, partial [Betaproteobacteria bacterium]|nr:hypothetical protein [Betaproteobacteria bacterium]